MIVFKPCQGFLTLQYQTSMKKIMFTLSKRWRVVYAKRAEG